METHRLAIAALDQVALSKDNRDDAGRVDDSQRRSSPSATGNYIRGPLNHSAVISDEVFKLQRTDGSMSQEIGRVEYQSGGAGLEPTSSHNSQITNTETQDVVSTPPTSDEFSSQSTNQDAQLSQLSQLSQLAAVQEPMSNIARPALTIQPTAGHKRTADGQVKRPAFSPISPRAHGHSRNTSAVSNVSAASSRLGEVC